MAMNAEFLDKMLLPFLVNAPDGCEALAFTAREPSFYTTFTGDEALEGVDPVSSVEEMRELDAVLVVGLQRVARRAAVAKVASLMACVDSACRAVADAFASAEERAARAAQAHAMHRMAHELQRCLDAATRSSAADLLAAWCRVENAATALDGFYDDAASPADKWRAFAREFARAAETPQRIWGARAKVAEHMAQQMVFMLAGHPAPPPLPNANLLEPLADDDPDEWSAELVALLRDAPE
jgi:hypothetical protein